MLINARLLSGLLFICPGWQVLEAFDHSGIRSPSPGKMSDRPWKAKHQVRASDRPLRFEASGRNTLVTPSVIEDRPVRTFDRWCILAHYTTNIRIFLISSLQAKNLANWLLTPQGELTRCLSISPGNPHWSDSSIDEGGSGSRNVTDVDDSRSNC